MSDWRVEAIMKEAERHGEHITPEEASDMLSSGQVTFGPVETHPEDWYWCNPGEVMIEEEFLQDMTDDGLFLIPHEILDAWEASAVREYDIPIPEVNL